MWKKAWIVIFVFVVTVLSACNGKEVKNEERKDSEVPQAIEVQLEVAEKVNVNEKIDLKAFVAQGEEKVKDADEVEFEVWEEGKKEESKKIKSTNNHDGSYESEVIFEHDGIFNVQVHVTARGLHTMPKKVVQVGESNSTEEHDEHGQHKEGFGMHFVNPKDVKREEKIELTVHLQNDNIPLEKAKVRYEIWNEDLSEKHEWVDAKESSVGEYKAIYTFVEVGTFQVQIHVENDEGLHEHEEYEIKVNN